MEEKDLRQAMLVLESYKNQLDALGRQINLLQTSLEESVRAMETLKSFKEAKEGDEILVPIGASIFVTAKVTDCKNAVVGIGSKVSVDKELGEAENFIGSVVVELRESLKKVNGSYAEVNTAATNLAAAINAEYESRQNA
jgi:prefoldin alpha subunit